jgi:protocatechuate 3,4-dioxygenase, beta subunit
VSHRPNGVRAKGQTLGLLGDLVDTNGKAIDGAEVEIWQCDSFATYHALNHAMEAGKFDPNFAGFGATRSGSAGEWRFITIRPVPYTIRAPHIHVKLRHPSFGEIASQLFIAGEPLNNTDFLWPRIAKADRDGLALVLEKASPGSGLQWMSRHRLVVPS